MPEERSAENGLPDREAMRAAHRDSYPMGNIHHGTPERPDWGTFCVECRESWPCEVTLLLDFIDRIILPEASKQEAAARAMLADPSSYVFPEDIPPEEERRT